MVSTRGDRRLMFFIAFAIFVACMVAITALVLAAILISMLRSYKAQTASKLDTTLQGIRGPKSLRVICHAKFKYLRLKLYCNIARVPPNLISIGVFMVHFSTYARPCVHPMTCASQMGEPCARSVIKKLLQRQHHKICIYQSLKLNETFKIKPIWETIFAFFLYREFCN